MPNLGYGGIKVRFTGGTGTPLPTFPTTPTPPSTGKTIGFVRLLGHASANSGTKLLVPITTNVRATRYVCVFTTGQRTPTHGGNAQQVTAVTDSRGSTYTIRSTFAAHPAQPQFLAVAKLSKFLASGSYVAVTWTRTLVAGAGNTALVFECFGLSTFITSGVSTVAGGIRYTTCTASWPTAATPTGVLSIATLVYLTSTTTLKTYTPTTAWTKRQQVTYNDGHFPGNATSSIQPVFATRWQSGTPKSSAVKWTPGAYLALWVFAP